uniref:DUF4939 domain-containing protein n=1 Tax=Xiphophorus maculatus TaxID=8083 RepID=A0A3B5Q8L6_XIPMA
MLVTIPAAMCQQLDRHQLLSGSGVQIFLIEIANFLKSSVPPTPSPDPIHPPTPERFTGDLSKCQGFLLRCSIIFNHSSQSFAHDSAKIAYVLSLLSRQALAWAQARFPSPASYNCSFDVFLKEFRQIFSHDSDKSFNSHDSEEESYKYD